jgi:hypothetical protein
MYRTAGGRLALRFATVVLVAVSIAGLVIAL